MSDFIKVEVTINDNIKRSYYLTEEQTLKDLLLMMKEVKEKEDYIFCDE